MKKDIEQSLTEGLLGGYAGSGEITKVQRGPFSGMSSHSESNGNIYHDEWFVPNHAGGGQELVQSGEEMFTRLYAGGTSSEILAELGITADDVGEYLKKKLVELGGRTRLFEDCRPAPDGDWQYLYEILRKHEEIGVVVADETITYKETLVHSHPFILSPLK